MSIARNHVEKTLQRLAEAAAAREAEAAKAEKPAARRTLPPVEEPRVGATPGRASTASRYRAAKFAKLAALAANDNAAEPSDEALAGPYGQMRLQLVEHMRQLKAIQSTEKKVELKKEILPLYADWVAGVLQAGRETGQAVQDEVVMTIMVWRIDAGDYMGALEIADHALNFGLQLPARFDRTLACLVAEQIAEAALQAPADAPIPNGVLDMTAMLVEGRDMPDQVKAKLCKAQGQEMARLADNPPAEHAVAGWRPLHLKEALELYRRALTLNPKVGVVKEVERLERELKKEGAPDAP